MKLIEPLKLKKEETRKSWRETKSRFKEHVGPNLTRQLDKFERHPNPSLPTLDFDVFFGPTAPLSSNFILMLPIIELVIFGVF